MSGSQLPPDTREDDLGTYQMLWDCPYCGLQKLLALDHKHCPDCSCAQDPTRRYFPTDADKVKVEDHVFVGKDLICAGCGAPNAAAASFCGGCGAELEGGKAVRVRAPQVAAEGAAFVADSAKAARDEAKDAQRAETAARQAAADARHGAPPVEDTKSGVGRKLAGVGCGGLFLAALVCGGVFVFWKKDVQLEATALSWTTTIAVEEKQSVTASAWRDELPAGAERVSCRPEKRGSKSVQDGEDCKTVRKDQGDGTFKESKQCAPKSRQEDVMADKCTYTALKWVKTRDAKATGDKSKPVSWADPKLRRTGECVGCERVGSKTEAYTIQWREAGGKKTHSCTAPRAQWDKVKVGDKHRLPVGVMSGAVDCSAIKGR